MTVADTIFDTINDNWGGGGYGGATPKIETTETQKSNNIMSTDVITVYHAGQKRNDIQVNDKYADKHYTLYVHVSSRTSAAQSKLLYDEVEYLLRNTTMTGVQLEKLSMVHDETAWKRGEHKVVWTVEVVALLSDGAVTSAAGATASMQALLMYGAANAAWVPCIFEHSNASIFTTFSGMLSNSGATDGYAIFKLPLPTVKGTLKLYVKNIRISIFDADAGDMVINTFVYGLADDSTGTLYSDGTDLNTVGDKESGDELGAWGAADDCSPYVGVVVQLQFTFTNANDFEMAGVSLECYYA